MGGVVWCMLRFVTGFDVWEKCCCGCLDKDGVEAVIGSVVVVTWVIR
jgi:hypothetical protein